MNRVIISVLIILLTASFVLSVTYPGIPCQFLFSGNKGAAPAGVWPLGMRTRYSRDGGMVYALKGAGASFSGETSRVFYTGLESSFEFEFFVKNMEPRVKEYELSFFLNYKRVSPGLYSARWESVDSIEESLQPGDSRAYRLMIDGLPEGRSELCYIFLSPDDLISPYGDKAEESFFYPREMSIVQVIRGYNESPFLETLPIKTSPCEAKEDEIICFIKENKLAVLNPFEREVSGVLFFSEFDRDPVFYRVPGGSLNFYRTRKIGNTESVYNVSGIYAPMEDFFGTPLYPHVFMSGN